MVFSRRMFLGFLALLATPVPAGESTSADAAAIRGAELLDHIKRLASDEWEGRGSGTPGERKATEYIAAHFSALGLAPAGENGTFFQSVEMPGTFEIGAASSLAIEGVTLRLNEDWRPFSASSSGRAEGEVVFAGYGITAPKLGYDDYDGLDVAGKVVVVLRGAPRGRVNAAGWRQHAAFVVKLRRAVAHGAIGLIVANNPRSFPPRPAGQQRPPRGGRPDRLMQRNIGGARAQIPFAHMTLAASRRAFPVLFSKSPDDLETEIHAGEVPAPASRASKVRVVLRTDVKQIPIHGRNVCGLLRAGAPGALDEVVVVGAHHDHVGIGGPGSLARSPRERKQIHNGADDNASGTSGLLEVAQYLASRRGELKRSILFLTFTGEERGLLGSRYFVEHPTIPLTKQVAMLNMDMIGRLDTRKLFVGGVKTSPLWKGMLERHVKAVALEANFGDGGRAPSDNTSFYDKGMPVLFFFSGMHREYHRPADDWNLIDFESAAKIARLCAAVAEEVANRPERPKFQRADSGGMGPPRAILGINVGAPRDGGVTVARVTPNGPAARAGLQPGDVILELAGGKMGDMVALVTAMRQRKIGEEIILKIKRGKQILDLALKLGRG